MSDIIVKTNSPRAWLLAARPKTLTAALTPVIIGLALAAADRHYHLTLVPAVLCVLFAVVMQIDANFINDYFDYRKGDDNPAQRLGPRRACAMGWITPSAMRRALLLTTVVAAIVGLPLIFYGGWAMAVVGIVCLVFCFLYTTTFAGRGLGDFLVLVFFGIVPVACTYYLQTGTLTLWSGVLALFCGMVIDNLLIVNNYRDIDNDRRNGKITLVVRIGRRQTLSLYFFIGCAATFAVLLYTHFQLRSFVALVYLFCHCHTYRAMKHLTGTALNRCLAATARNNLLFGVCTALAALL